MSESKNKKYAHTPESKFADKLYITTGALFALGFSFYLLSEGMAWISLLISAFVTWICFGIASRNKKKGWWIFLGCLSIIFDILNLIATIQLFI